MTIRNAPSSLARVLSGAALAAAVIAGASASSAVTCTPAFPSPSNNPATCQSGNSRAQARHFLGGNPLKFQLSIDMQGGTLVAYAYGINVNGTHLNQCATTVADDNPITVTTSSVPCSSLYGTAGTANPSISYNHPTNMASTFIVVL